MVALLAGALVGGVGGAIAASQGVAPGTVTGTALAAGGLGAIALKGQARWFALGVGAVGAGQGGIRWWNKGEAERQQRRLAGQRPNQVGAGQRQGDGDADADAQETLERARRANGGVVPIRQRAA